MNESLIEKLKENIKECVGVPYIWGGVTLQGFDCSGLMQYLYKQIGKDIPRTSQEQYKFGKIIRKSKLKFGDLVFFNFDENKLPSHVTMYIDEDKMLEAPRTGENVRISKFSDRNDYCGARRILN